jgi:hypothetical protein
MMIARVLILVLVAVATAACNEAESSGGGDAISARRAADMIFAVLAADREVYTTRVVNRLIVEQNTAFHDPATGAPAPLRASEHWKTEPGTLPLPAQMFRMGAAKVAEKNLGMTYVLLSEWPINKQNAPTTAAELAGLRALGQTGGASPHYAEEILGGVRYLTAVYPDVAVAQACLDCHNRHPDSPRRDFALGDVMGGVVIRIPL